MSKTGSGAWIQCGREFNAREIEQIREMVAWLPGLARRELAATVCEHLNWHSASGTPRAQACEKLLEKLEAADLIGLPARRLEKAHGGPRVNVVLSERTGAEAPLTGCLGDIEPVRLEAVIQPQETGLWNEYVERFHPLGYKGAFGYRLRYFIRSGSRYLGCVLLAGAARAIAVRDRWIGWNERIRLCNLRSPDLRDYHMSPVSKIPVKLISFTAAENRVASDLLRASLSNNRPWLIRNQFINQT